MVFFRHHPDDVRMDLQCHHQFFRVEAHGAAEAAEVFLHVFQRVPPAYGQIQAALGAGADAAKTGGEPVGDGDAVGGQILECLVFLCSYHNLVFARRK